MGCVRRVAPDSAVSSFQVAIKLRVTRGSAGRLASLLVSHRSLWICSWFSAVFNGIGPQRMNTFFHSAGMPGVWAHWLPSSPGGRFENSPAVDCRVRMNPRISPAGTAESPMSYVSSYCLFRTKDRPRMAQPSLRDFGYLLPNPTLERVGYSQISLREIGVG